MKNPLVPLDETVCSVRLNDVGEEQEMLVYSETDELLLEGVQTEVQKVGLPEFVNNCAVTVYNDVNEGMVVASVVINVALAVIEWIEVKELAVSVDILIATNGVEVEGNFSVSVIVNAKLDEVADENRMAISAVVTVTATEILE
ncbi:hypothetical protein HDU99_009158 [Rhizoclosmatium hyalinum]|nr:hypothetical protein HDU99_009158 [Rhizoclosmatium hyalinum]